MKATKVIVRDVTASTLSNADGMQLQYIIDKSLADGDSIILSFHDVHTISSSFLNSSLGNLIDKYGFDTLSRIKIVDYTSSVASFIKKYISDLKTLANHS